MTHASKDYANESDLKTEPIYSTQFKIEAIDAALLESWANALPKEDELLDYPPPNVHVPSRIPQAFKAARNDDSPIGKPTQLRGAFTGNPESEVWFKQDDQFEQPYVYAKVQLETNDLMFPVRVESHVFVSIWQEMLKEHIREL